MDKLAIKTEHGSLVIYVDSFFPCTQARLNKLLGILRQFPWLNDIQGLMKQLDRNLTEQIGDARDAKSGYAKLWSNNRQRYAEYGEMLESGKRPNGVPLTEDEKKDLGKKRKAALREAKECRAEFEKISREEGRLTKNLEMLKNAKP